MLDTMKEFEAHHLLPPRLNMVANMQDEESGKLTKFFTTFPKAIMN